MRKRRSLASVGDVENKRSIRTEKTSHRRKGVDMFADEITGEAQRPDAPPEPNAALKSLEVMVGAWDLEGREAGSNG
jgi:hypothetical protein